MNLESITIQLLEKKSELELRLERTHKHIYQREEPVSANFSEQVKQTENDGLVMTLEAEAIEEIAQINIALKRIDNKNYTECSKCGGKIAEERLQAIPYSNTCINCAGQK